MERPPNITWKQVAERLSAKQEKMWSLSEMERTGGETDVISYDENTDGYIFYDCSKESPIGRRNTRYDHEALVSRKNFKPENSAIDMAKEIGIEIRSETEYKELEKLCKFYLKTSSWVKTPTEIRKMGGAIFCDRRYDTIFT